VVALLWAAGCGSSSSSKQIDAAPGGDTPACQSNQACSTNPGGPCITGKTQCQGEMVACVDAVDAPDNTTCPTGVCTHGACIAPASITGPVDLSTTPTTPGRTCAESPELTVTALTPNTATVLTAPAAGCFAAGDEVLLINLQGAPSATVNVGNWELLTVASVAGSTFTFTSNKTKSYGSAAQTDGGIGAGTPDQKVALIRVPQFGALSIASSGTLTSSAWNGNVGGVVVLHASSLSLDGVITAAGLGYRNGRWSQDTVACTENVATEAGESIDGLGSAGTAINLGGPGGIAADSGKLFSTGTTPLNSGASHATTGLMGRDSGGHTIGAPGTTYGVSDASKLTIGSGAAGNLTCDAVASTHLVPDSEKLAGGIILIVSDTVTVGTTGSITASANMASRDISAAGGYIFIQGTTLSLGTAKVTALGGSAPGSGNNAGTPVTSGNGYIVVKAGTVTGTTNPTANQL